MAYRSDNYNGNEFLFLKKKRKDVRVPFSLDIYYPNINNNIKNINLSADKPVFKAVNMSEGGMCFTSSVKIKRGDFISFLMKIENNASFPCLTEVLWVGFSDDCYVFGCEFIKLEWYQIQQIKCYIRKHVKK